MGELFDAEADADTEHKKPGQETGESGRSASLHWGSNAAAEDEKKEGPAHGRIYKPAGHRQDPREEDKQVRPGKRKSPPDEGRENGKKHKSEELEGKEDPVVQIPTVPAAPKSSYKIMITGGSRLAEYKKVASLASLEG